MLIGIRAFLRMIVAIASVTDHRAKTLVASEYLYLSTGQKR